MQDLTFISEMYMPAVAALCLAVGYILKHWLKDADNRIIPTVLAVLGAVCVCASEEKITIELVTEGMITGLASTGLHQAFKQIMEKSSEDTSNAEC